MKVEVWGRTKSYRFNDQFDIDFLPKEKWGKKKKSDQQPGWGGGSITNFQFKVLPADSPGSQLHKTGLEKNRVG